MKRTYGLAFFAFLALSSAATAHGQQAKLEGHVYDDKDRRVKSVRVVVTPGGQGNVTDGKGHFEINLPDYVKPGQAARISVGRRNWVVFHPMFGVCITQSAGRNLEQLRVVIVSKDSPLSYETKRLSEFVDWLQKRVGSQAKTINAMTGRVDALEREREKYAFLREYAENYGVSPDAFKAALDEWSKTKDSDDKLERARKEYWAGNLDKAKELTEESGPVAVQILKQRSRQNLEAGRTVINTYTLQGNILYEQYKFREALAAFSVVDELFETHDLPLEVLRAEWAETKLLAGDARVALGRGVAGEEGPQLFKRALVDYQQSATVYTREQSPHQWAVMKNSLGNVLLSLGVRAKGAESIEHLKNAEASYRAALEVRARQKFPEGWAVTQTNLGSALRELGERVGGEEGVTHLREAVAAHRAALEARTREQSPRGWATTQDNLANALQSLSERKRGAESVSLLQDAVAASRASLDVRTRANHPQEWAATQNNLGNALWLLGRRTAGHEGLTYLSQAAAAYRAALEVITRQSIPQEWATMQSNLGGVLTSLADRMSDAESVIHLRDAVAAFRAALEVMTRDHLPQDWAVIQNNLGAALTELGEKVDGEERVRHLKDAAAALRATLEVVNRAQLPQLWATTQDNLGNALLYMGVRAGGPEGLERLNEAVEAYRAALEVRTIQHMPQQWAMTQNNLGNALRFLGARAGPREAAGHLNDAVAAHRAALEVFSREHFPQQWALVQTNLAKDYTRLNDWAAAAEAHVNVLALYPNNVEAYGEATSIYQDRLFKFDTALALHQQWLRQYPQDTLAQVYFAETQFSAGHFAESLQLIGKLRSNREVPADARVALRAIEVAALLAAGEGKQVKGKFDELIADVTSQPPGFKADWGFDGPKYFIANSEKLASQRKWLGKLFDALASEDSAKMVKALTAVRGEFKE